MMLMVQRRETTIKKLGQRLKVRGGAEDVRASAGGTGNPRSIGKKEENVTRLL